MVGEPSTVERRRARDLLREALRCNQAVACGNQFRDLLPVRSGVGRADAYPALAPDVGGHEEGAILRKQGLSLEGVGLQRDRRAVRGRGAEDLAPAGPNAKGWVLPGLELERLRQGKAEDPHTLDQVHTRFSPPSIDAEATLPHVRGGR